MNVQNTAAAAEPRHSYNGFVIAYVQHEGPVKVGYMGRLRDPQPAGLDGMVHLEEACEIMAVMRATRDGVMRTVEGAAIESSPTIRAVTCRPLTVISLDDLQTGEIGLYQAVERMANEARASISYAPPRVVAPGGGLVGPDGSSLGGGR